MDRKFVPYSVARADIHDADLLLFQAKSSAFSKIISVAGRSEYSHAATAAWWGDSRADGDLFCLEVVEWHGGRAETLSSQVDLCPGVIDVFMPNAMGGLGYNPGAVVRYMRRLTGCRYGWFNIFRVSLMHLPFIREFVRPDTDISHRDKHPPFCSQARVEADEAGGGFPVMDLARSPFYRYKFTLIPDALVAHTSLWFELESQRIGRLRANPATI